VCVASLANVITPLSLLFDQSIRSLAGYDRKNQNSGRLWMQSRATRTYGLPRVGDEFGEGG
jgi:hypothetical protein